MTCWVTSWMSDGQGLCSAAFWHSPWSLLALAVRRHRDPRTVSEDGLCEGTGGAFDSWTSGATKPLNKPSLWSVDWVKQSYLITSRQTSRLRWGCFLFKQILIVLVVVEEGGTKLLPGVILPWETGQPSRSQPDGSSLSRGGSCGTEARAGVTGGEWWKTCTLLQKNTTLTYKLCWNSADRC